MKVALEYRKGMGGTLDVFECKYIEEREKALVFLYPDPDSAENFDMDNYCNRKQNNGAPEMRADENGLLNTVEIYFNELRHIWIDDRDDTEPAKTWNKRIHDTEWLEWAADLIDKANRQKERKDTYGNDKRKKARND